VLVRRRLPTHVARGHGQEAAGKNLARVGDADETLAFVQTLGARPIPSASFSIVISLGIPGVGEAMESLEDSWFLRAAARICKT
jgi:hypothetical protein